jgi:CheY-like chemotaxis protein
MSGSILLVDDETKILNALASALRGEGHEVVAKRSGCSASACSTCSSSTI